MQLELIHLQKIIVYSTGVFFICISIILGIIIYIREKPVKEEAMFFFRGLMSLGGAGFAVLLTGLISVEFLIKNQKIGAGGAMAIFLIFYLKNPPKFIENIKKKK